MKNNLSGRVTALFMASLIPVVFSACGEVKDTAVQNDAAETTASETVTEESSDSEAVESAVETTAVTTVSEAEPTTESTAESAKDEDSEAETVENIPPVTDDRFDPFIEGLSEAIREGSMYYEGPENTDSESTRVSLDLCSKGFSYTFIDIDNDGEYELFIGDEYTDSEGEKIYTCKGFVVITPNGDFKNLASSWTRSRTKYIGGPYFHSDGSGGANLHEAEIYRYDHSTQSLTVEANLVTDSDEPDPSQLPIMYYTLYEGTMWDYQISERAKDDPNALHGDEAQAKWNEYIAKASAETNKLENAQWIRVDI
ncbi:hypothetical protein [Ruminococcus albus]|uniref:Uncharacterized protein n=1 Tax=Ruminococcus albus TaxID=1264 RepID=A0A1I1PV34_RUMAL|nr:hypothetical protein [Ruminococcus albus]SFD13557.1 hypothetical protein SAMN02910406_03188 [Ruminococcus albus]